MTVGLVGFVVGAAAMAIAFTVLGSSIDSSDDRLLLATAAVVTAQSGAQLLALRRAERSAADSVI